MITDLDIDHTETPANLMKHAEFMHKVGRLKRLTASWKDLFFAEAHDLNGTWRADSRASTKPIQPVWSNGIDICAPPRRGTFQQMSDQKLHWHLNIC